MNNATVKKRARDLQRITGMPYQSAHRAVTNDTEREASIRSGLNLSDFVTPQRAADLAPRQRHRCVRLREQPSLDAERGPRAVRQLPRVPGRGVRRQRRDLRDHHRRGPVLRACVAAEMYYNWAPPLAQLGEKTQAEYFWSNWRTPAAARAAPLNADPSPWDLEWAANASALTRAQVDLLQAIADLSCDSPVVGTRALGSAWPSWARSTSGRRPGPWHGTNPAAAKLRKAGLIKFHSGHGLCHAPGQAAQEAGRSGLEPPTRAVEALRGCGA